MNTPIIFGLSAMVAWGLMDFLAVYTCKHLGNYKTLLWSQLFGFLLLMLAYFFFGAPIPIDSSLLILVIDGLAVLIGYVYFYKALENGLVSVASPISSMWAAVAVIMGAIILHERLSTLQIIAIVLVILGCALVSGDIKELFKIGERKLEVGVKEGLVAMLAWGSMVVFVTPIIREIGWFMPLFVARIATVVSLFLFMKVRKIEMKFEPKKIFLVILILTGVMDVFGFIALNMGLSKYPASLITPITAAYPLVTAVLAYIFYKERLVLNQYIGILGIIAGLIILSL